MKIVNNVHYETRMNMIQMYIRMMMSNQPKTVAEATSTQPEQLLTVFLPTDEVTIPTEKVGCILVTSHLHQFLEDYPPSSDKHAFLDIYHLLSLLDKYLYDNPKQHTHCMSSDNDYGTLLKYAICLNIDLSTFPTLWAGLYSP